VSGPGPEEIIAGRACAWPRRPKTPARIRLIDPREVPGWILHEDDQLLVVDKPGDVVCHPSKAGPWSSLVGALREHTGLPTVHLIFRLDRETSGVVVLAKTSAMASRLQTAQQRRTIGKRYQSILTGRLDGEVRVDQALGDDVTSPVFVKSTVVPAGEGKAAATIFRPLASSPGGEFTLADVILETGRKHQIRAHAHWLGCPVVGDKIYGPDARLYLEFIDGGWTAALAARLLLSRQALHCAEIDLRPAGLGHVFHAPLAADLRDFCRQHAILPRASAT
jgi:23S rRNA pseudouridine1911/1915/1917 synthase